MSNITQVVGQQHNLTTLSKGISASGLDTFLKDGGPYTFFAPSNEAFGKLEAGTAEDLLKPDNKEKLAKLLRNHIVPGNLVLKDLRHGDRLKTIDGNNLQVTENWGKTSIGQATIQDSDVPTSNGTIHLLDRVLLN